MSGSISDMTAESIRLHRMEPIADTEIKRVLVV